MKIRRSSGILLPVFSLPSEHGIGTLGKNACAFIDFLKAAKQKYWQMLPVTPGGAGNSPYSSDSVFAGNPYFIDPELLAEDGLLTKAEIAEADLGSDSDHVDYGKLHENHAALMRKAYARMDEKTRAEMKAFRENAGAWLENYALYVALRNHFEGKIWIDWPDAEIRKHHDGAIAHYRQMLSEEVDFYIFLQYLFFKQWEKLRAYAKEQEIGLIGDIPIYVSLDSADVWSEPHFFQLDEENIPVFVAGVPPDYFSEDGQLWGNPLYDWNAMERDGYGWWIRRIDHASKMFDVLRIDHFRGFASYWAVPYGAESAKEGHWVKGPGEKFVNVLTSWFSNTQFIAEDLGMLTQDVFDLIHASGLPGMKILEFAFDPVTPSSYLPHYYERNCICYTGTHDNSTLAGWIKEGNPKEVAHARKYLGSTDDDLVNAVIRGGMGSVADLFIAQMQDYLGLDNSARINVPGVAEGNWTWKLRDDMLTKELAEKIAELTVLYGRN